MLRGRTGFDPEQLLDALDAFLAQRNRLELLIDGVVIFFLQAGITRSTM